jgi:hypothetical protein
MSAPCARSEPLLEKSATAIRQRLSLTIAIASVLRLEITVMSLPLGWVWRNPRR